MSEIFFDEYNSSEVDEAGEEHDRANFVLEEEEENICSGKGTACMLRVNKTDGGLTRPDLNLPVVEKGNDRNKLTKETAQDKSLEAWKVSSMKGETFQDR